MRVKLEAFVHLTNNASYPLMVLLAVLIFPAMVLRRGTSPAALLLIDLPLFLAATASVLVFYALSQRARGAGWQKEIRYLPALMGLGVGLSVSNGRAVVAGLFRRGGVFHRTPKYRIERRGEDWLGKRYRAGAAPSLGLEILLALYFAGCTVYAAVSGMWMSLPFLLLFLHGYSYMAWLGLLPALSEPRARRLSGRESFFISR